MTGKKIMSVRLSGPVLNVDVDWHRQRVAAVVFEAPGTPVFEFGHGALCPLHELGVSMQPSDGEAATDLILHPHEHVAISVGWNRQVRVWSLDSGQLVRELGELTPAAAVSPRRGFYTATLSTCGRYLDTQNLALRQIQRFDWTSGDLVASRWCDIGPVARHADADLLALAAGADGSIAYFASCDAAETRWAPIAINLWISCSLAFAPGALAGVGGSTAVHAIAYDFPQLTPRFAVILDPVQEDTAAEFGVSQALAWAPDGRTLYVPGGDGDIVALDANSGREQRRWRAHEGMVTQLLHHPTDARLLSAGLDGRIVIHETYAAPARDGAGDVDAFLARFPPLDLDPEQAGDDRVEYLDAPDYDKSRYDSIRASAPSDG